MSTNLQKTHQAFVNALLDLTSQPEVMPLFSTPVHLAKDRFAIYRGNSLAIWYQALSNAFPVMKELVGSDFFENLARNYGRQFASQSGDLNQFGDQFSVFLEQVENLTAYRYFPDMATLEWRIHRAYYAADQNILSLSQFLSEAGTNAQQARLQFHTAASLFSSRFAVGAIWHLHQQSTIEELEMPIDKASFLVICRPQWKVELMQCDESEFVALNALQNAHTLEDALERALNKDESFNVGEALQRWFSAGLFCAYSCKDEVKTSTNGIDI